MILLYLFQQNSILSQRHEYATIEKNAVSESRWLGSDILTLD